MPKIMMNCPTLGKAVPTGLDTETILFNSLRDVLSLTHCPACGQMHKWGRKNSWVEKTNGQDSSNSE
jgi:hypothetical protein